MYGLIHKELRAMVLEEHGDGVWRDVVNEANVPDDSFLTMRSYDDAITYALVGAVSRVLELAPDRCLHAFGRYWLLKSAPRSYAALLEVTGDDVFEFLGNLDALHDRITTTFMDYRPPSFHLERLDDRRAMLHYRSTRSGLTPFVLGLLDGVATRFACALEVVDQEKRPTEHGEHTVITFVLSEAHG